MRTLLCLFIVAALAGLAVADTNVTGKWSGSFNITNPDGDTNESTAVMLLKQSGATITGTVGPNEEQQFEIQNGKIEGSKITLEAGHDGQTIKFDLVLADNRITGEASMSRDGQTAKAKVDVTRAN
jgi:hypothetical protein